MNSPVTMLQSFSILIKDIFNSNTINFLSPLSHQEFQALETYCLNHYQKASFHSHDGEVCYSPNLKYILSYRRNYITFRNNNVIEGTASIPVLYCENCRHYHAILPCQFVVPYCQYSIPFIFYVIYDKKYSSLTVEKISEKYGIAPATIYRWMK